MVKSNGSASGTPHEDELLVRQAVKGDTASFDTIVRRYQSITYAVAYRFFQNRDDALDISQEVFVKAFRSLGTWKPTGSFKSWLLRIATNMSIDHLRRRGRMPVFVATDELREIGAEVVDERFRIREPSEHASDSELGVLIRTVVDRLPDKQKAVFVLRHYEGFSLKEIAEIMGCTEGTIKTHLFRATGKLRNELADVHQDFMGR